MKPDCKKILAAHPDLDCALVREHGARLTEEYFQRFDEQQMVEHLRGLARLTPAHPVELLLAQTATGGVECTVLAFDYPFEFSLLTGVLAGMGFSIESGDIFTYARPEPLALPTRRRLPRPLALAEALLRRRRIVDHFSGQVAAVEPFAVWSAELRARLVAVIGLLEKNETDAITEAKRRVNEWVTQRLAAARSTTAGPPRLYPVQIFIEEGNDTATRMKVVSQDTPAFLYSLSTALSLHGISIEHVRIRTIHGRIEDELDLADMAGGPIRDTARLNKVKLSVLFTKQFTYFLDKAPDPFAALSRFEQLMQDLLRLPESGQWTELLANPQLMQDLARLLGTSDYVWEDFIRLQYETLLPILKPHLEGRQLGPTDETLEQRLAAVLAGASDFAEQNRRLNTFKDREIYLIDLDHILNAPSDFRRLSERLSRLAEVVVRRTVALVFAHLVARHGRPRTVAGLEAAYTVLGLGKMGGAALGYASDIELLFVFGDAGQSDGPDPITNAEFFERLAREAAQFIAAKRDGIFHVDLRLRPHGQAGPLACSLENFCRYYGPGGPALSYERLALVRLRTLGGDAALGAQVERLRDDFVYAATSINMRELRALREKQYAEKKRGAEANAKFSPGALVDLEYAVQLLQVQFGREQPELRSPRVHTALAELQRAGVLGVAETGRLIAAYDFLRRLINSLRMLRGSALDLYLPPVDSDEFVHLARRCGYAQRGEVTPERQLYLDFETNTAAVRAFVEKYFGRDSLPGPVTGNLADVVLSDKPSVALRSKILRSARFQNIERAYLNLRRLGDTGPRCDLFAQLAILACDVLRREPDPDMALNNWERFVSALPDPSAHFAALLAQPKRLEILMAIFSRSQFLADALIRQPDNFAWVTDPANLQQPRQREQLDEELGQQAVTETDRAAWLGALRRWRRRELLRIGTRDMCLHTPTPDVMLDLSNLAEACLQAALERAWDELTNAGFTRERRRKLTQRFCILAFGKLGGRELNYSSDIDLLAVYTDSTSSGGAEKDAEIFAQIMESVRAALATITDEGYAYRVDLRLRPYGGAGAIALPLDAVCKYYRSTARLWEIQALLKLRPVAGQLAVGAQLLRQLAPLLQKRHGRKKVVESIHRLRTEAMRQQARHGATTTDVKSGLGGLRDVEFLAQGLQLMHARRHSELLTGNTLQALDELAAAGLLPAATAAQLSDDYVFLRRVEHYLQILEDRQIHALPTDAAELTALAKRMSGLQATAADFTADLHARLQRVHQAYLEFLHA